MTSRSRAHSGSNIWEIEVDHETSRRLGRVRQRGTKPETIVRSILTELGHRYRLDNGDLPGRPDVANRRRRWAVFVHGCFWHHHAGCTKATIPKHNRAFWLEKFEANRARDRAAVKALEQQNVRPIVIWECDTTDRSALRERLKEALEDRLP